MVNLGTSLFLRRWHVKFKVMLNIIVCIRFSGLSHVSASPVNTTIENIYKFDLKYEKHNIKKNYGSEPICYFCNCTQERKS